MSDVDHKNNELVQKKRDLLRALETATIEHVNLIRDLKDAEEQVRGLKAEVERAECRRDVARTAYEQAEMAYTSYKEGRAREEAKKELKAELKADRDPLD